MMLTTVFAGTAGASYAAENGTEGGLLWYFKDSTGTAMTGVSAPAADGNFVFMASGNTLYKFDAATGEVLAKAELSGSVGYNKIAPTVADGKVFVPLGASKLDIIDEETMVSLENVQYADAKLQSGHQSLTPAVYSKEDNAVYLGSWRPLRADADFPGGTYAKVSLDDYTVTKITDSVNLDLDGDGKKEKTGGFYWEGACAYGDYVVFGSVSNGTNDANTPSDGNAVLYAYDKITGEVITEVLEDSGSICSTVVYNGGKYYFTGKAGNLYEATIADGKIQAEVKVKLAGPSTCTPEIADGKAYVGSYISRTEGCVQAVNLDSGEITETYETPADAKYIMLSGDNIYCTYNGYPGGIYDVKAGINYFTPASGMQNYCISGISAGNDGVMYYTNDSNHLMAVGNSENLINVQWESADGSGNIAPIKYTGSEQTPEFTVTYKGKVLGNTEYRKEFADNKYPGTAALTVRSESYPGIVIKEFTINEPVVTAQKTVTAELTPESGYDDVTVKWSTQKVEGTTVRYKVEYQKYGGSWNIAASSANGSSTKKMNLSDGVRYRFKVTPFVKVNGNTYSGDSKTTGYVYTLKAVKKPSVKKYSSSYVKVSWNKVNGVSGYKVYRSKYSTKNFKLVKTVSSSYAYAKIKTSKNAKYYYKVRPYKKIGTKYVYGPLSSASSSFTLK